jgi:hypothetical protein
MLHESLTYHTSHISLSLHKLKPLQDRNTISFLSISKFLISNHEKKKKSGKVLSWQPWMLQMIFLGSGGQ